MEPGGGGFPAEERKKKMKKTPELMKTKKDLAMKRDWAPEIRRL